jgi:hypothetical protein
MYYNSRVLAAFIIDLHTVVAIKAIVGCEMDTYRQKPLDYVPKMAMLVEGASICLASY